MKMPWTRLRELGIVGLNQRNAEYIMGYNERRLYPLVDNKLLTKTRAQERSIPVPELYAQIEFEHEIRGLANLLSPYQDFVVKPANGSGGSGIMVVSGRNANGMFRKSNDSLISLGDIEHHVSNILSGMYSLGGDNDLAIIEYRVKSDRSFDAVSFKGVPDIRLIVFRGIPLFGMIRLPTSESDGRANLHQGAVGVGIDFKSGSTLKGVMQSKTISIHPDTGSSVSGMQIPGWQQILHLGASCYELAPLGYLGVDIVVDETLGPMMLELNARPGLAIQIANQRGLEPVLKYAQALGTVPQDPSRRVELGLAIRNRFDSLISAS